MKESDFIEWIRKNKPKITKPERYAKNINTISRHLQKENIQNFDLYSLTNSYDASELRKKYLSFDEFKRQKEKGHSMYSRSFDLLVECLIDNESIGLTKEQVIIQPIGPDTSIETFFENHGKRWAEKEQYRKVWQYTKNATVLFTKKGNFFAKATIIRLEEKNDNEYPLNYYYKNLTPLKDIQYKKILKLAGRNSSPFQTYTLLDEKKSRKIIHYINSNAELFIDEDQADRELQEEMGDTEASETEEKPQTCQDAKEVNGRKMYPRKLAVSKEALEKAEFKCEINPAHSSFESKTTGEQFVEAHHLIPMKIQGQYEYSLDVPGNIVSLCPNCHRKIHHGTVQDVKEMLSVLLDIKKDKLEKFGISTSLENLEAYY